MEKMIKTKYPLALDDWRFRFMNMDRFVQVEFIILASEIIKILRK